MFFLLFLSHSPIFFLIFLFPIAATPSWRGKQEQDALLLVPSEEARGPTGRDESPNLSFRLRRQSSTATTTTRIAAALVPVPVPVRARARGSEGDLLAAPGRGRGQGRGLHAAAAPGDDAGDDGESIFSFFLFEEAFNISRFFLLLLLSFAQPRKTNKKKSLCLFLSDPARRPRSAPRAPPSGSSRPSTATSEPSS